MVPNFEADTLGSALVTCADGKICAPGYEASGKGSEESVRPLDCKIVDIPRARREGIRQFVIGTDRVSTRVVLAVAETKLKNSRSIARVVETKFPRGSCPSFSSSSFLLRLVRCPRFQGSSSSPVGGSAIASIGGKCREQADAVPAARARISATQNERCAKVQK
jgi:hypothetical protein